MYLKTAVVTITIALISASLGAAERIPLFDPLHPNSPLTDDSAGIEQLGNSPLVPHSSLGQTLQRSIVGTNSVEVTLIDENRSAQQSALTYQQAYRGLPIWNQEFVLLVDDHGQLIAAYGELIQAIEQDLPVVRILSKHEIIKIQQNFIQQYFSDSERVFRNHRAEQIIYLDNLNKAHNSLMLSFFTDVQAGVNRPEKVLAFIDIDSGALLERLDLLDHFQVIGGAGPSGNSKAPRPDYDASLDGRDGQSPATFMLTKDDYNRCYMDALKVETRNAAHLNAPGSEPFNFDCTDSTRNHYQSINEAKSPLNDAHYNAQVTRRMYQAYLGEAPFLDAKIVQHVHYGNQFDNAFYEGGQLYYGDGQYLFYPMTTLDVVAHEIAHGYTANYGRGAERLLVSSQARAINEAFSDMSGEAAEFFHTGTNDWMSSQANYKLGDALRYLDEPTRDGRSMDHLDAFQAQIGEHYNAGIFNKAFHRLATRELPWNTQYAFTLFALANQQCWISNTSFEQAAHCVLQQAHSINTQLANDTVLKPDGDAWTTSELQNQIRKAFAQVGIKLITGIDLESDFAVSSRFNRVQFTDSSRLSGQALNPEDWLFEWDFGDDSPTSSERNPNHEFATDGPQTVRLTVTEKNGPRQDRFSLVITTYSDYCAVIGRGFDKYFIQSVRLHNDLINSTGSGYSDHSDTVHSLNAGQRLDFEIVSGDHPDTANDYKTYELWIDTNDDGRFQDSEKRMSQRNPDGRVSGVIDFLGELNKTYRMRLLVSGINRNQLPCGTLDFAEIEDYSLRWEQDDSAANYQIDIKVNQADNSIGFINRTDDERIISWYWDFDTQDANGNPNHISRKKSATFEYGQSGNYEVRLIGYDALNHPVEPGWSRTVVFASQTAPAFSALADEQEPSRFHLDARASQYPIGSTLNWDFNRDGLTDGTGTQLTYLFPGEGDFPVTLNIENPDNPDGKRVTKTISVGTMLYSPLFSTTYLTNADGSFTVTLHNESVDPGDKAWGKWQLDWDFGHDNQAASVRTADIGEDIEHTFPGPGVYSVSLTISYRQLYGWLSRDHSSEPFALSLELRETLPLSYCPAIDSTEYEHIAQVQINSQTFSNGDAGGLVNPDTPLVLQADQSNSYRIAAGYADAENYAENYHIWLDLNGDGYFGDNEQASNKTERLVKTWDHSQADLGLGFIDGNFYLDGGTFPMGSTTTRMRILQLYSYSAPANDIHPCADYPAFYSGGEIEDYLVTVVKQ